jgi:uncharacterized protein
MNQATWAHLENKYKNNNRKHRILALDGGGIRGLLTLEILDALEATLRTETGQPNLLLGDWFDVIGGTSTGAIIAAGLSRGMSVAELQTFYLDSAREMFTKAFILQRFTSTKFNEKPIQTKLQEVFGSDSNIAIASSTEWRSMFTAVTTNWNTLSPWPISNNPFAKYNDPNRPDCNLNIPLWQIVRASTAAPVFFVPEVIQWDSNDPSKTFTFVDGGMTPYNNPAFLMYRMCTSEPYHVNWPTGEDKLLVVSVGTGTPQSEKYDVNESGDNHFTNATTIAPKLMQGISVEQDLACRTVGRCVHGTPIDREVGDLIARKNGIALPTSENTGKAFSYLRFNADLSQSALISMNLADIDSSKVRHLDCVDQIEALCRIGKVVATEVPMAIKKVSAFFATDY